MRLNFKMLGLTILVCSVISGCDLIVSAPQPKAINLSSGLSLNTSNLTQASKHLAPILSLMPLPGNRELLAVDASGTVLIWNISTGKAYKLLSLGEPIDQAAFSPNARLLGVAKGLQETVYDLSNGNKLNQTSRIKTKASVVKFQSDGKALLVGGVDSRIYRWKFLNDVEGQKTEVREKALERYTMHASVVNALAPHPFGRVMFSGDWSGKMLAILPFDSDAYAGEYDKNLFSGRFFSDNATWSDSGRGADRGVTQIVISDDGKRLFLTNQEGMLEAWEVQGFKLIAKIKAHHGLIYSLATTGDGQFTSTVSRDGKFRLWTLERDPSYGLKNDALQYKFIALGELPITEVNQILLLSKTKAFAALTTGKIAEITLNPDLLKPRAETEPEQEPLPGNILDSDY